MRFLTLERLVSGSFASERERVTQFVSRLMINNKSVVSPFTCATLAEALMRVLECDHVHEFYHQSRGNG